MCYIIFDFLSQIIFIGVLSMPSDDTHGGTKMFRLLRPNFDYHLFASRGERHDASHPEDSAADEGLPSDLVIDPPVWEVDQ